MMNGNFGNYEVSSSMTTDYSKRGTILRKPTGRTLRNKNNSTIEDKFKGASNVKNSIKTRVGSSMLRDHAPMFCAICFETKDDDEMLNLVICGHHPCISCMSSYFDILVRKGGHVSMTCPECVEPMHPDDVMKIVENSEMFIKLEEFRLRRALAKIPNIRWCPAPDCTYAVIGNSECAKCPILKCQRPGCDTEFCYNCHELWHPDTECLPRKKIVESTDVKPCPKCMVLINKKDDESCNEMKCSICGYVFCWLCMTEMNSLHFFAPTGCTLYGKKKWSKTKIALSRIGTVLGGPLGIGVASVIAIPAITIGVPVYVGRKIRKRFAKNKSTQVHKRNLAITCGVALSAVLSPVLAALAVGVGVPVALGYVYGVIPFHGFLTSVNIFDDEDDFEESEDGEGEMVKDGEGEMNPNRMLRIFHEVSEKDLYQTHDKI